MLKSESFLDERDLCDFVKEHGLDKDDIQCITYDATRFVLFYWW